ncbi:transposase [Nostoc commune NIES-4072]|uniref:Transposase n=1 Tax=Nostoc commune NIES-4072 TaxID=2005467 RepID=A0A2R5FUU8_NOSCO|nr:IS1634 family transposase [Nostoc commune]BBD66487.1 transposase [Nostoc commune HK-02]GBG22532.1 transposase [Nostoc commune NIES-4072]
MSNLKEIEIKNIDHLGIIAGIIDSIGLVDIINELIGQEQGEKISPGQVVKAMILNGLGFVSSPLYMFSEFFEDKPCEHLIGKGVKAEYLNDDKLGRVMDKLFIKGLTEIFLAISSQAVKEFNISLKSSHLDSTSLHLHGEYSSSLTDVIIHCNSSNSEIQSARPIEITYGYSRDHRPDLKQFIIDLISSGDGDIPIFLKSASGNQSDSSSFAKIFLEYKEQIQKEEIGNEDNLMVADAALYNAKNISSLFGTKWLCRVPMTIRQAKELASTLLSTDFISSSLTGYYYSVVKSNYGGVEQRWLVVESTERKESDLRQLERRISKSKASALSHLKKLLESKFNSHQEAIKAVDSLNKKLKYHQINYIDYLEKESKNKKDKINFYEVSASLSENINAIKKAYQSAGRFVLATNILDEKSLSNDDMLSEYKAQQSCERGFGFLKDPLFFADSIFLKSPERIEAMAMIMGLCLLIYTLAQRQIRKALSASESTIKNQLGKSVNNPTMRWIFQCFQSIHLVKFDQEISISNLTSERKYILSFLPETCGYYYKC